mgnify:CR=1 FL=1
MYLQDEKYTQNILNYNKTFFDNHNVSATTVIEYQKERNQSFFGVGTNLLDEFYDICFKSNKWKKWVSSSFIPENNKEKLQTDYRIKSFSDFVNHCIMGYLPTIEKQLKHTTIVYGNNVHEF